MKRQDAKDLMFPIPCSNSGHSKRETMLVLHELDVWCIFDEYKKLKKAIKKHKKETHAAFGTQHHGVDTELWEVLNDN